MTAPVSLHSIPLNLDTWAKVVTGLSAAQEGVLLRAVRAAWTADHRGAPPATLPNDDAELARIIGERQHVDVVRRFFRPREEAPGQLEWHWLVEEYRAACGRYLARKMGGVMTGARKQEEAAVRRLQRARRPAQPEAQLQAQLSAQHQAELKHPDPYSSKKPELAAGAAPAVEGRASPPQNDPPPLSTSDVLAWADAHPDVRAAIEQRVDAQLDEDNPGWRARAFGAGVRNRLVVAQLTEAFVRVQPRVPIPLAAVSASSPPIGAIAGAAHA